MGRRGFTLVEVIISMAIVAAVAVIAMASLRFTLDVSERGEEAAEEAFIKRYFSGEFRRLAASAYPYRDEDGEILFRGEEHALSFVTSGATAMSGAPWGGARLLEYSMNGGRLLLREAQVPYAHFAPGRPALITAFAERIEFSYLGPSGWERVWEISSENMLPRAIRVVLHISGRKEPLVFRADININTRRERAE